MHERRGREGDRELAHDGARGVGTGETGLAHTGAIVDHDSRYLFLHFDKFKQL